MDFDQLWDVFVKNYSRDDLTKKALDDNSTEDNTWMCFRKTFYIVQKSGEILVDATVRNCGRLFLVGIHIFSVIIKADKIGRKVSERFNNFFLFFFA